MLPAAVPIPKAQPCFYSGTARANTGSTIQNDEPATPAPTSNPAVETMANSEVE